MATFAHQYVEQILKRESQLSRTHPDVIPSDILTADAQAYSVNLMQTIVMSVIMKVISEFVPQVTDAVWLNRLDHALDASAQLPWPQWILDQDPEIMPQ